MTQLHPKEIERRLADQPTPPPPAELLEAIQAEIPEPSELSSVAEPSGPSRQRRWLIAASLVVAVGGGLLGYHTFTETDVETLVMTAGEPIAVESSADPADDVHESARNQEQQEAALKQLGYLDDPVGVASPREPAASLETPRQAVSLPAPFVDPRTVNPETPPMSVSVRDSAGQPLPGVSVELQGSAGSKSRVTGSDGTAEFETLDAGEWTLRTSLDGFSTIEQPNVEVSEGKRTEVEVEMSSAVEETITVTSESPLLDERRASAGAMVRQTELRDPAEVDIDVGEQPVTEVIFGIPEAREQTQELAKPKARPRPSRQRRKAVAAEPAPAPPRPIAAPPPGPPPSTGGTHEPNDQPYGDVFYREYGVNPFLDTEDDPLSTFALDVDTGSYSITRRYLDDGNLPPREAIRVEEFLNYFDYRDAPPSHGDFAVHSDLAPAPFASGERYQLLRFGIRGREVAEENRKPATLIFVVDISGSMAREDRLGLVRKSLTRLLGELRSDDFVGLVVYGSTGQVLLTPTSDHSAIRAAIERLQSGGSTNAEHGLTLAYDLASRHLRDNAINRIILCSDGVANVGATGPDSILERVRREAERGIELTTVGFGMGNYNDVLMEQLADKGDGNYAYVDDLAEADRVFVENLTGTLQTIAGDAKVQVEFNPESVSRYRLIGYENRDVADDRFRDDTVDAGEIGAGHSVVALYEIKLRRDRPKRSPLATLRLRWHSKASEEVVEVARPVRERDGVERWKNAPDSLKLAAAVAEFAEQLKGAYWAKDGSLEAALRTAQEASAGYAGDKDVAELVGLIAKAAKLRGREAN